MYERILIPTDGSDHAIRAAEHAMALARAFDASVRVIGVVDIQDSAGPFNAGGVDDAFVETLHSQASESIEAVEALTDQRVETDIIEGTPANCIADDAAEFDADLIVMGTHGRTGVHRYVVGSVTERVVRLADAPVLTARAGVELGPAGGCDDVLIPTDGSDLASVAVEHGIAIAEQFDARVHAVSIVDVGDLAMRVEYTPPTEALERVRDQRTEATEAIADRAREAGLEVRTAVREGFPAEDLIEYADEEGIDLLAMGTHGRTGLNRFLLGSTTERIIRHADAPVLAVNARERDD
ncbi:Nucleotide-binding universal stress protein, UspA family [Halorientalis persicus]|uniref:Nucleotide-binding universal stress protein, UspA family n=1 Tax=Halorientalis persicus TaxID=1367881 RepID=A0A1H8RRE3_9EURY|nr:universal stress protein [Halorientalis persicus]SEO68847.1 Nucleotide-binding universal stress protein, UspA family [Halorientalis persicus]